MPPRPASRPEWSRMSEISAIDSKTWTTARNETTERPGYQRQGAACGAAFSAPGFFQPPQMGAASAFPRDTLDDCADKLGRDAIFRPETRRARLAGAIDVA